MHYTTIFSGMNSLAITRTTPDPPFLGVYDGPILKEEAEETTLEECAAAWEDARPSDECPCRTTCGPNFGTTIPYLVLGFCTAFGTTSGQKVHIRCLDCCTMLGTSSVQDDHILCLDFCTVAATHQDVMPKLLMLASVIQLLHTLSFSWRIAYTRKRVILHKITPALHKCFSEIVFVRNCIGQQGSWDIMEVRVPGLHAKYFGGTIIPVNRHAKRQMNTFGNITMTLWKVCLDFCTVSGAYLGQRTYYTYIIHAWRVHGAIFTHWQLAWRATKEAHGVHVL